MKLVGGGSVINGAYPFLFENISNLILFISFSCLGIKQNQASNCFLDIISIDLKFPIPWVCYYQIKNIFLSFKLQEADDIDIQ